MTDDLKPCPFCGGEAQVTSGTATDEKSPGGLSGFAFVRCMRCGIEYGRILPLMRDALDQVVAYWNSRVVEPLGGPRIEATMVDMESDDTLMIQCPLCRRTTVASAQIDGFGRPIYDKPYRIATHAGRHFGRICKASDGLVDLNPSGASGEAARGRE